MRSSPPTWIRVGAAGASSCGPRTRIHQEAAAAGTKILSRLAGGGVKHLTLRRRLLRLPPLPGASLPTAVWLRPAEELVSGTPRRSSIISPGAHRRFCQPRSFQEVLEQNCSLALNWSRVWSLLVLHFHVRSWREPQILSPCCTKASRTGLDSSLILHFLNILKEVLLESGSFFSPPEAKEEKLIENQNKGPEIIQKAQHSCSTSQSDTCLVKYTKILVCLRLLFMYTCFLYSFRVFFSLLYVCCCGKFFSAVPLLSRGGRRCPNQR